jgi:SAM-dependent methyltransferase
MAGDSSRGPDLRLSSRKEVKEADKDAVAALAEEIRAAVAAAAPDGEGRKAPPPDPVFAERSENVRRPLGKAGEHLAPSIPEGAPLSGPKKLAVRLLRFLWREQTSFNALSLEAHSALLAAVEDERSDLAAWRQMEERERKAAGQRTDEALAAWARRAAIQDGRLAALEERGLPSTREPSAPVPGSEPAIPPGVYSLFEERFRGALADVAAGQRFYLSWLRGLPGLVCDVGCGRGEFLALLAEERIPAMGVDTNPLSVTQARERGLEVEESDGVSWLSRRAPASLGGVVAFQVVEHWSGGMTFAFLRAARRALAAGGVLIVETINTDSLSALKAFFLDPTHVRPVPAEALRFLAEAAGFAEARIEYRAPLPAAERLEERSENDARLKRLLFGPQDYALVARVPAGA